MEADDLRALLECMVPSDADPGAVEMGAVEFVFRLMEVEGAMVTAEYEAGLSALDRESDLAFGVRFSEADLAARVGLLKKLERGETRTEWPDGLTAPRFIATAARHAIEGCFSDPGNGGNRNEAGWKMLGFRVTV